MVRLSILAGLVALSALLSAASAKGMSGGTATGIHASIDLRTLS